MYVYIYCVKSFRYTKFVHAVGFSVVAATSYIQCPMCSWLPAGINRTLYERLYLLEIRVLLLKEAQSADLHPFTKNPLTKRAHVYSLFALALANPATIFKDFCASIPTLYLQTYLYLWVLKRASRGGVGQSLFCSPVRL
jgi:hypothetical protein